MRPPRGHWGSMCDVTSVHAAIYLVRCKPWTTHSSAEVQAIDVQAMEVQAMEVQAMDHGGASHGGAMH